MLTVRLTPKVEAALASLLSKGTHLARVTKKAQVLRLVSEGHTVTAAAAAAGVCRDTARTVCLRFAAGGLKNALYDKARPGHAWLLSSAQEAQIVAMVCSAPPKGLTVWTAAVIVQEAVSRRVVEKVSKSTITRLLKRHALKPWREKNVVRPRTHGRICGTDGRRVKNLRKTAGPGGACRLSG